MKKVILIMILFSVLPSIFILPGCGKNIQTIYHGQDIITEIAYQGNIYKNTGESIATEKIDATETLDNVTYISSVLYENSNYDVYSIKGIDTNQAIAIKFWSCGETSCIYVYFKFKRQ